MLNAELACNLPDKIVPQPTGLPYAFTDKPVTAWGGLRLMQEMLLRINFRATLDSCGLMPPGSNRGYNPATMMESFMVCVWIGGARFSHTAIVRFDDALKQIFGWKSVGSVSTFTRFFGKFKQQDVDEVFGNINRWFWSRLAPKTLTLDLDSSVVTRYGQQEGVAVGYNPHKRGRPAHHPLFAFAADIRMAVHAWLRPGDTASSSNVNNFFEEALTVIGPCHKVGLVRADSGFFVGAFLSLLESKRINYIVSARMNPVIRNMIAGLKAWVGVDKGIAVSELRYEAHKWGKERRIIVVRQEEAERPQAKGRLLFKMPGYRYQAYVTDLGLSPVDTWRLYRGRADSENRIEELKNDFGASGFCLDSFYGTEAAFRTVLVAYNLMSLFRQALLLSPSAVKLPTMRFQCFAIGSWIGANARRKVIRLGLASKRRAWFDGLFARIEQFHAPWLCQT